MVALNRFLAWYIRILVIHSGFWLLVVVLVWTSLQNRHSEPLKKWTKTSMLITRTFVRCLAQNESLDIHMSYRFHLPLWKCHSFGGGGLDRATKIKWICETVIRDTTSSGRRDAIDIGVGGKKQTKNLGKLIILMLSVILFSNSSLDLYWRSDLTNLACGHWNRPVRNAQPIKHAIIHLPTTINRRSYPVQGWRFRGRTFQHYSRYM